MKTQVLLLWLMDHASFMHYLRHRTPNAPGYDLIPRRYPNAKGVDEIIILTRNYWEYADWL